MPTESFPIRVSIMGENKTAATLPQQVTKQELLNYIRQRWTDEYVQREMVKYFSKFPSNTLNHMVSRLDEIAAKFERDRNASDDK